MKTVLLVTDVTFWERTSGHRARISALVEFLSSHTNLTVIFTGPIISCLEGVLNKRYKASFFILEKTKYLNSNGYGRRLKSFLVGKEFDATIIEYIHCSYFLDFININTILILDAHDIISQRALEFKKFNQSGELYEISEEVEKEIFGAYDHVIALTSIDRDLINKLTKKNKALLCPHPMATVPHKTREKASTLVFVASSYIPNRDALAFFINDCWPVLRKRYNIVLKIYGSIQYALPRYNDESIMVAGFVEDTSAIYEGADIVINPVRFGAGLKIKNIEAMAYGLPLVTTSHGARGIETGAGSCYKVADTANQFITTVSELLTNKRSRQMLSNNAISFIQANFSPPQCFTPLMKAISRSS